MKLRNYVLVTAGYWAFTLTDGALRMLVLLYFHELGYSPVAIAFLFLLYEFMGIVTNLIGGWVGARSGLNRTLVAGVAAMETDLAPEAERHREAMERFAALDAFEPRERTLALHIHCGARGDVDADLAAHAGPPDGVVRVLERLILLGQSGGHQGQCPEL